MATLYDTAAPMVRALAMRVVRNRHLADEVTQEAFITVWRTAGRFDTRRGSGRSWIATIAHRRAVDCVRRESRHGNAPSVHAVDESFDPVAEALDRGERRSVVRAALHRLSPKQRQAVGLAYFGSMTQEEVAAELGVPLGTAKSRIRDGMLTMRRTVAVGV